MASMSTSSPQYFYIGVLIDCTHSMQPHIAFTREQILRYLPILIRETKARNPNFIIRIGFVAYRDFDDEPKIITLPYTSLDDFSIAFEPLKAFGGHDTAEDVRGALLALTQLDYIKSENNSGMVLHICDAPGHGKRFHDLHISDSFPRGSPGDIPGSPNSTEDLIAQIAKRGWDYGYMRINTTTDKMFLMFDKIFTENRINEEQQFAMIYDITNIQGSANGGWHSVNARPAGSNGTLGMGTYGGRVIPGIFNVGPGGIIGPPNGSSDFFGPLSRSISRSVSRSVGPGNARGARGTQYVPAINRHGGVIIPSSITTSVERLPPSRPRFNHLTRLPGLPEDTEAPSAGAGSRAPISTASIRTNARAGPAPAGGAGAGAGSLFTPSAPPPPPPVIPVGPITVMPAGGAGAGAGGAGAGAGGAGAGSSTQAPLSAFLSSWGRSSGGKRNRKSKNRKSKRNRKSKKQ